MVSSLLYALVLSVLALGSYLYPTRHTPHAPHGPNNDVPIFMRAPSQGYPPAYPINGTQGAVTCEVDVCSFVGTYLLAKGGSATDAVRISSHPGDGRVDLRWRYARVPLWHWRWRFCAGQDEPERADHGRLP